jgi:hypothetical protein
MTVVTERWACHSCARARASLRIVVVTTIDVKVMSRNGTGCETGKVN